MSSVIAVTEMLATRLCHDLTGPIGAINNGTELLQDEGPGAMQNEAFALIADSAEEATNRIQFYRQIYGRIPASGEANLAEKKQAIEGFYGKTKVQVKWGNEGAILPSINHAMARIFMNMVLIAGATLIKGGVLHTHITEREIGGGMLEVKASGEVVKLDEETLSALQGQLHESELSPKAVQPFLMMQMIDNVHGQLTLDVQPSSLTLKVSA